jgi:hypothetical protein
MKKFLLPIVCLAITLASHGAQIVRGPYLEDPTHTTLILRWQTDTPSVSWLEYGPAPRCNQIMTLTTAGTKHKAVLYGLVPNQDFCYRIYVQNSAADGVQEPVSGSFRTLFSAERKVVKFLAIGSTASGAEDASSSALTDLSFPSVIGDSLQQDNAAARQEIADLMAQEKSDFLIHTGNITHSGLNEDADAEFFTPFKEVLRHHPLFVAVGPNEYGPDRSDRESKSFFRTNYSLYHDMSWSQGTPKYYFFDTANARFIFLDTNDAVGAAWAPEISEKSKQTQWLETALSSAGDKWKIVVMNAPAYSTGPKGPNAKVAETWVKLFEDYRVNLVLQGGDADYERTFPIRLGEPTARNGVTYVTLGTTAATPAKRTSQENYTQRFVAARHYASAKIVDRKLTLNVFDNKGKKLDTLELYN